MAAYTRLGSYILADELTADPFGKLFRGLTIAGSTFDRHFLVRSFSDEIVNAGLGEKIEEMDRVAGNLAGNRGLSHNYHLEGGKAPVIAMDHMPGRSLAQMIDKAKAEQIPLGVDHTLSVLQGLAQSVISLHSMGIRHGMLSPHSIWINFEGATQIIDAPFASTLHSLMPRCPILSASLARYRRPSSNPLHQDLFSLGAILYELLTFEKLPAPDQIPAALNSATLKAAQEDSPIPAEILELLNRLLMVKHPFENSAAFGSELERVLYDGDYSPTTFNMAFFMHTLFREENELDNQAIKADQTADFTAFALDTGMQGDGSMSSNTKMILKLVAAGVVVVVILAGAFGFWSYKQRTAAERAAKEAQKKTAEMNLQLQLLDQKLWEEEQRRLQREHEVREARNAQAKAEAQRALESVQREIEENKRKSQELIKQRAAIQPTTKPSGATSHPTPPPAPVAPPPTPAPVIAPPSAPSSTLPDTPPVITQKAIPQAPRLNKSAMPSSLLNTDVVVTTKVFVDAQGRPLKVLIEKGVEGSFGYHEAAREAALSSTYSPATKGGKPSSGWITLEYRFGKPR